MRSLRRRSTRALVPESLALSRAGAIAVVLDRVRSTPTLTAAARIAFLGVGSTLIAAGVAALLWTGLGPGPLDVLITATSTRWSFPITFAVWGMATLMVTLAMLLGRRPGPGTLVLPLVSGALLPVFIGGYGRWDAPEGITLTGVAVHVAGVGLVGVGAGLVIVAGLGAGMGELLAAAASDRTGRAEPLVRTGIEASWLLAGVALGGTVGPGTFLVAVLIGPSVRVGYRAVAALTTNTVPAPARAVTVAAAAVAPLPAET